MLTLLKDIYTPNADEDNDLIDDIYEIIYSKLSEDELTTFLTYTEFNTSIKATAEYFGTTQFLIKKKIDKIRNKIIYELEQGKNTKMLSF